MNKKKIISVLTMVALTLTLTLVSVGTEVKASGTTIPYKEAYGQQSININDYAKAMKINIGEYDGKNAFYININGKGLVIYPSHKNVYVDGTGVPLKTEVVKDYFSGEDFNFPIAQDIVKDGEGYLIPKTILELLGIKCGEDGIDIPDNPTPPPTDNGSGNGNQGGDNSSGGNQGGGNSGGNGNGGTTTPPPVTPPVTSPTPPVAPPKPPVEPSNPTGITLTDLKGRLPGLGFTQLDYMTWNYSQNGREMGRLAIKDGAVTVGFFVDNASYDNSVRQIFNLLLPTQGGRLMNIISSPFDNQRLTMDGKLVVLKVYAEGGIGVTICNNAE